VLLVHKDLKEIKAHRVTLVHRDHKVLKVLLVHKDLKEIKAHRVTLVHRDHKVHKEILDLKVHRV